MDKTFSQLSDDVILKILFLLEDDPRGWARLSCVSNKFCSLISTVCCKSKCISTLPSLSSNLLSLPSSSTHGGVWSSLYKIAVCCPGLHHSGVLLDHSDFGLLHDLGPHEAYLNSTISTSNNILLDPQVIEGHTSINVSDPRIDRGQARITNDNNTLFDPQTSINMHDLQVSQGQTCTSNDNTLRNSQLEGHPCISVPDPKFNQTHVNQDQARGVETWTLYDDLYLDSLYDNSETIPMEIKSTGVVASEINSSVTKFVVTNENDPKRRKIFPTLPSSSSRLIRSHLASGIWNVSREQGKKLLASRFRDDSLYISDWPGCIHMEEKRNYMVFRGVFKNFKRSGVWRTINEGHKGKVELNCAFCESKHTWDLHSAFCLKRGLGFHDDGHPVVRAYVCDNGHVSGAWTDFSMYG